jgi:lipopolysaccharide/colanic/teichoic acid biosynthesis glycosyltransferase
MDLTIINQPQVFPYRKEYQIAKRVMDMALCLLALPLALLLMAICALAIRCESAGPVLFIQERIGKGGRRFRMYKFRTMQHNLDDSHHRAFMKAFVNGRIRDGENGGAVYKPIQASQVTRVGHILRKASLDELPQLINVLKGEMSLVGPRPNVPWEVEEYQGWHNERLEVLPGITGLAQVRGRSGIVFDSIVKYDIEYIERQSLALDLKILWWTISSVFIGEGAE